MSVRLKLSDRHQNILRATIQHYIATAEPVGSKTLVEEYNFSVSSATVRNVLGRLEKAGLLYQPHTSSGRVPSDQGYRTYVDQLIVPDEKIGKKIEKSLNKELNWDSWSFEALLQRATQILANLSGYIALITLPQSSANRLRHLQLVQVSSKQLMLIMVTDSYQTQSVLIDNPLSVPEEQEDNQEGIEEELQILSNFLNSKLKGLSLAELATLDWSELDQEFTQYTNFLKKLLRELARNLQSSVTTPIIVHGVSEVLRQPEFSQLQQIQMLLHLLEEEQDQLLPLVFEISNPAVLIKRVRVKIGSENPLESMRPCALISATYNQGDLPIGSVGIIGPTRMLYENTIPLVESTADYLSDALS
ncbi:heat-inducible transcription repressor HrcA [Gloeothece citriformis PCC 7424]|uniref:Heat-inducible transcription repressor HrcA n=1 Tax=Gloeothece citriformis (strain PCC 7424) TaxID=65393 RepID=B7K745_GLOC7|nr:heat-inducible transcriptional repressor HrcA [Gloeothece citriformis]ACK69613.1 heat-inducible transcription repressor HrcA [Gloeothece citriformis PCC 7424]